MTKPKRYLGKAVLEFDMWVEFDSDDIPEGMDSYDYARQLAENGGWKEEDPLSGEFRICEVSEIEE
tara:strand:- start:348 stop:545 length:198 start_codon:yes stop_codon:yes gene_type:complete